MKSKLEKKSQCLYYIAQYGVTLETKWCLPFFRVVEKGYYSERDAADAVKQVLEAVAVSVSHFLSENGLLLLLFLLLFLN